MRSFALVALDERDNIIDRYKLDLVSNISGLGYSLNVSTVDTDVENYVTKIVQKKKPIKLTVNHLKGYVAGDAFDLFCEKYTNSVMCLEYNNGRRLRYIEGIITDTGKSELNLYNVLEQDVTFQPLTPFFEKIESDIRIKVSSIGKSYPFKYPFSYGVNVVENNLINNTYIKDIPLIIEIKGSITNPQILLKDENDESYNIVSFPDLTVLEGETLIINSAQKKIWFDNGSGILEDYYYKVSNATDSYLRAKSSTVSKLSVNLTTQDTGELLGRRRQYGL